MLLNKLKLSPIYDIVESPKKYTFAFIITLISFVVMVFDPSSTDILRYQSEQVSNGQIWRLITANVCHSNWNHWALNIVGLWLMDIFYRPVLSVSIRTKLMLFCMLFNVVLLHYLISIDWYVGLSGALHGYLIGGALLSWNKAKLLNFAIITVTTAKLIIESYWQINSATEELIGANVLEEAHSFGGISAVLFWLIILSLGKIKKTTLQ